MEQSEFKYYELVDFGNFLLKKVKAKAYSLDGDPIGERQVTDADIKNWLFEKDFNFKNMNKEY